SPALTPFFSSPPLLYPISACIPCQNAATSLTTTQPRHSVLIPGSPSPLRPKKPPFLAIHRTHSPKLGTSAGNTLLRCNTMYNACHSTVSNIPSTLCSGSRLSSYIVNIHHHTTTHYV